MKKCHDRDKCVPKQIQKRLELQWLLERLLGSKNVYFEPPSNVMMRYPCIRYRRSRYESRHADNCPYLTNTRYELIYIHSDPDDEMVYKLSQLPMCTHDRPYIADGLIHDIYTIYY